MTKESIQEYSTRVTQANSSQLVVILFELILNHINDANENHANGDVKGYEKDLRKAQSFLNELMGSLDYQYEISYQLMSLYMYVNRVLAEAIFNREENKLFSAETVIDRLLTAYREVAKQDFSEPLMGNTQQIHAGFTYGKGSRLNEVLVNVNEANRGFRA
jgi:flagellar protein FliS